MAEGNGKEASLAVQRRQLLGLPAKKKLDALIDSSKARQLVQLTPAEELYAAIAEVGLADSTQIVQLASPAQFRTFVDLGGWKRDRVDPHQLLTWLRAARGDEPEDFLRKVHGIDLEVLELLLRAFTRIHDREEDPDVALEGVTLETPEGKYLIEILAEGAELSAVRALVNDLIGENPFEAVRLLEAIRWDVPSELEEIAYRFRSARLQDLGFPELYDALGIFTFVDPESVRGKPPAAEAGLVAQKERVDFLAAALAGLGDDERDAAEQELRYLANSALVADGSDPGDLAAARRVAEQTRDTLNLGFEWLSFGEPARAADVLRSLPVRRVFQIGFSLGLKLKFRADRLWKLEAARVRDVSPQGAQKSADMLLALDEESRAIAGLRRKRPLRVLKVEGADPVAFRSLRELAESEQLLARAESQARVLRSVLGADEVIRPLLERSATITVEQLWNTAVAWALVERPRPQAFPAARLHELSAALREAPAKLKSAFALEEAALPDLIARAMASLDEALKASAALGGSLRELDFLVES